MEAISGFFECYHHTTGFHEVDPYGIVHHSVYLIWAELGLQNYLSEAGLFRTYEIIRINCKYLNPAHNHDEIIVRTRVKKIRDENTAGLIFPFEIISGHRLLSKGEMVIKREGSE